MSRFRLLSNLSVIGLITAASAGAAVASERLVATTASASATTTPAADLVIPRVRQLPPDIQQDPGARVMRLQQVRRPIMARIKALPEARYRQEVRPSLARQLKAMGFDDQDVAYFLTDLDKTRGVR
jgi:hypothetical protein